MDAIATLDAAGRQRSPATLPGYHAGRAPRNKGRKYPADPPRVEEIVAVMRQAGERPEGMRFRGGLRNTVGQLDQHVYELTCSCDRS